MKLILGIDLETTSLDPGTCEVIEVGAVLWDVDKIMPVTTFNALVAPTVEVPPEILELTGLAPEYLETVGVQPFDAVAQLCFLAHRSKALVAHNGAAFDFVILDRLLNNLYPENDCFKLPRIDTMIDLPYPDHVTSRKLTYVAAEYGILNPFKHRAVFDVMTMLSVLSKFDINSILVEVESPVIEVYALVNYENREKARAAGFSWDPLTRTWRKRIRQCNRATFSEKCHEIGFIFADAPAK